MKTIPFVAALTMLISSASFAVDLVGTWQSSIDCLRTGENQDPLAPGVIQYESNAVVIAWQDQGFYKG